MCADSNAISKSEARGYDQAMAMTTLILASGSPRRAEILRTLEIPFTVIPSGADESLFDENPKDYARRLAVAKATDVSKRHPGFVLGADTIVEVDGEVLGKPVSDIAARRMLELLSGREHEVSTGVALVRDGMTLESIVVTTKVRMRSISVEAAGRYIATGEGADKAGGYAIQGLAGAFVTSIHGSYSNVVGLPAAEAVELLERHRVLSAWPPSRDSR